MKKAKDIMTTSVVTIDGSATVAAAMQKMKEKGVPAQIVERRSEEDAYGIVTETDIVYKVTAYGQDPAQVAVHAIMTKPCIVVNPDLGVEYVARLFANTGVITPGDNSSYLLSRVAVLSELKSAMQARA